MTWNKSPVDSTAVRELARRFGLDRLPAAILTRRGITDPQGLRFFLTDEPRLLHNPFLMSGMTDAVERINAAIDSGERIVIFGDRDVDGVTSTVLLYEVLVELGADVQWMLPEGEETYGLSPLVIERMVSLGATLLVTVDCGVSNAAEIELASARGVDAVVVDHHNPPAALPPAIAVVNPKLPGYPFRDLSGCGVVSKLDWALRFSKSPLFGAAVCLLNVRPANDTLVIEAIRLTNLVESGRISESIVPGMVAYERTRLAGFLGQDELTVLDAPLQARLLSKAFGQGVSAGSFSDLAPLLAQFLPDKAGKSLLRILEGSGSARFALQPASEIDALKELFIDLVLVREESTLSPTLTRADLVALGTLADLMPLVDENRVLARRGLAALASPTRSGLRQVMKRRELLGKRISAAEVTWQIAPLLNSAGRMGDPGTATKLLLAQTDADAEAVLEQLLLLDNQRRSMGEAAWNLGLTQAKESLERTGGRCVMVHDQRIQRGITGVMASRLQGYFKAPSIVIAEGAEIAVGSIRCNRERVIEGFFARHGSLFQSYGGHDFAGGFSLSREKLEEFLDAFYRLAGEIEPPSAEECIAIDAEIPIGMLTPELIAVVDLFEPFGEGNPPLAFLTRGLRVTQCELIGRKDPSHLKLLLDTGRTRWPAVYWNAASRYPSEFSIGDTVDVVYRLSRNTYGGGENLQLTIVDLKR